MAARVYAVFTRQHEPVLMHMHIEKHLFAVLVMIFSPATRPAQR